MAALRRVYPGRQKRASLPAIVQVSSCVVISSKRPAFSQVKFDEMHATVDEKKVGITQRIKSNCYCTKERANNYICSVVPIVKVIKTYKLKEYALIDFLAGITVGILHIPQALAFGMLASVKTVNGLYTSFWPVLVYMIFGTSPHVSMGTSAVICILTASIVDRQAAKFVGSREFVNITINGTIDTIPIEESAEFMDYKENVAMATSLVAGLLLLIMGKLRLGFITAYLSESFFSAFTTGAAIHIATSQLPAMLGLQIPKYSGCFKLIKTYISVFENIVHTNIAALVISLTSIVVLYVIKEYVNEKFKHKLKVPIPIELLVIIAATVVSYFFNFTVSYDVAIVGFIPATIPAPVVPDLTEVPDYALDCFILAILIFANTIAMAKICAKKHNYEVDDNQELVAYGLCNFLSSFMWCFPSSIAPPRSMVASSMNCKTQISGLFAAILMLLVMTVITTLFASLPKAVLGAVIVIALKGLFMQLAHTKRFWHINKFDFMIWICTFLGVVFLDIDYGLMIGVGVSLITVVLQTQFARGYGVGKSAVDGLFIQHNKYKDSREITGVKIFRYLSSLYFANAEIFRSQLYGATINPRKLLKLLQQHEKIIAKAKGEKKVEVHNSNGAIFNLNIPDASHNYINDGRRKVASTSEPDKLDAVSNDNNNSVLYLENRSKLEGKKLKKTSQVYQDIQDSEKKLIEMREIHHVIIDCSAINYLDASGANVLIHIFTEYSHVNISLFLASCSYEMRRSMKHAGVFEKIPRENIFFDVPDAISVATTESVLRSLEGHGDFSDEEAAEDSYVTNM